MKEPIIVSTEASKYFAEAIANQLNISLLPVEQKHFGGSNGELYYRFESNDRFFFLGRDVIVVASTNTDEDCEALYRWGCALAKYGARKLIFVIPFLGYSTMERAVRPNEIVSAKAVMRKFSSIPQAALGNYFLMMDLHVSGLVHYFEGDARPFELYAEDKLTDGIIKMGLANQYVFGSADLGRPQWVKTFARKFNTNIVLVDKDREGETTHVVNIIGDVQGKEVVIYDDMTRSGSTLVEAAEAYLDHGALEVYAVLSHGAFNNKAVVELIEQSSLKSVLITNTHPMSQSKYVYNSKKIVQVDVTPVFASVTKQILE